ncbi:hypothetical protein CAOG_03513 [Capsaspora owczarzaki ATCC 30864]|uniref:UDENN domain-containing protein n=1 Tax=Capsaspora owczarzaki (strain ATCC 30864) TaxID=595528 RepID=A0A0D2UC30_CAPO3|nr:hypothetical protein CAOG_03513 [Capsaspora owczarzaki ATCC 30864]KJE92571.1 hypothetical protein CAOG_003513 [Capsaspora owczarzaki ATCC 30864]|eukprot:XP_004348418.1 hypothetical protein CAOG_03513 [Capsaspora owczarzaki ATCC 30864]
MATVISVMLVSFHHTHGPQVEFAYPAMPASPSTSAAETSAANASNTVLPTALSAVVQRPVSSDNPASHTSSLHSATHTEAAAAAASDETASNTARASFGMNTSTAASTESSEHAAAAPTVKLPVAWAQLPFLAMPDGAHSRTSDLVCFTLPMPTDLSLLPNHISHESYAKTQTVFGLACFRQQDAASFKTRSADVTRNTIQKSVVVLSLVPIFGFLKQKTVAMTEALFDQRDFTDLTLLELFYSSISATLASKMDESSLFIDLSCRSLVLSFKHRLLMLYKALLLERKIIFAGPTLEASCFSQLALLSLMPGLVESGLFACAKLGFGVSDSEHESNNIATTQPSISSFPTVITDDLIKPGTVKQQEHRVLLRRLALPFSVFGEGCVFLPYLSLLQLDTLRSEKARGVLAGVSSMFLLLRPDHELAVTIDLAAQKIEFHDDDVKDAVALTTEDLRFMSNIVSAVESYEARAGGQDQDGFVWEGSDGWIRAQFESYTVALAASTLAQQTLSTSETAARLRDFGARFIQTWWTTANFAEWKHRVDSDVLDTVSARHPFAGQLSVNDVSIRLNTLVASLDPSIVETGGKVTSSIVETGGKVTSAIGGAFGSFTKSVSDALKEKPHDPTSDHAAVEPTASEQAAHAVKHAGAQLSTAVGSAYRGMLSFWSSGSSAAPAAPPATKADDASAVPTSTP